MIQKLTKTDCRSASRREKINELIDFCNAIEKLVIFPSGGSIGGSGSQSALRIQGQSAVLDLSQFVTKENLAESGITVP